MMRIKSRILRAHLEKHNFDQKFLDTFEQTANGVIKGTEQIADELKRIHDAGAKIVLDTDFDTDGIMCGVIGKAGLSELGFNVELYNPSPSNGYGFHKADVDNIIALYPDVKVILTADVGISAAETVRYAMSKGIEVLVTDHHKCSVSGDYPAFVTVDPYLDENCVFPEICGAFLLWQILDFYTRKYANPVTVTDMNRLRLFAGIATISDMMPLLHENRQLVRDAVSIARYYFNYDLSSEGITPPHYSKPYAMCFAGFVQLLRYFADLGKIRVTNDIDETFFAFYLVPMLNSVKRMEGDMYAMYEIFFSQCLSALPEHPDMCCVDNAIKYLCDINEQRKLLVEQKISDIMTAREYILSDDEILLGFDAEEKIEKFKKIAGFADCNVYITDAPGGICGLLAQRMLNMTGMPCLVIYENPDGGWNGSGRSPAWFPFLDNISKSGCGISAAGHNPSFGVRIPDENALNKYREYYNSFIVSERDRYSESASDSDSYISLSLTGNETCDFVYDEDEIRQFLSETELLHPYGQAFPAVTFRMAIPADACGSVFGRENNHVKLITKNGEEFVWYKGLLEFDKILKNNIDKKPYVVTGAFQHNYYTGGISFVIRTMKIQED